MYGAKQEYPPLLPLGWHPMDMAALRRLCVGRFPMSITRPGIMDGFEVVVSQLNQSGLRMELWVNGSFVTEKLNPSDVDFLARAEGPHIDAATIAQKRVWQWLAQTDLKTPHKYDAYTLSEHPEGHVLGEFSEWRRAYWLRQFGFSRGDDEKGLAVIRLPFVII